jgi:hypothetical protein
MRKLVLALSALALTASSCMHSRPDDSTTRTSVFLPEPEADGRPAFASEPAVLRHEFVRVQYRLFSEGQVVAGDTLSVALFDDVRLRAEVGNVGQVGGVRTYRMHLLEPDSGSLLLSMQPDRATGTLDWTSTGRRFHLRYDMDSGHHVILEVDPEKEDTLPGADPPRG